MTTTATANSEIDVLELVRAQQAQLDRLERKLDDALAGQRRKDWYTTAEVAERRGVGEDTVREWCRLGQPRREAAERPGAGPALDDRARRTRADRERGALAAADRPGLDAQGHDGRLSGAGEEVPVAHRHRRRLVPHEEVDDPLVDAGGGKAGRE